MKKIRRAWSRFHSKHLRNRKLRFARWLDARRLGKYCWADCVSWSINPWRLNPFKIDGSGGCKIESEQHSCGTCYCGAWSKGKCYDLLSAQEKREITEHLEIVNSGVEDLPF